MKQMVKPGGTIDAATPDEIARLIPRPAETTRIRPVSTVQLDANGNGTDRLYVVPAGYRFEVQRIVVTLTGSSPSDPNTGNVALNVAGKFLALQRSGSLIEYLQPMYGAALQVPGTQSWGKGQGPTLQNKEVLEVVAAGLTANGMLSVYAEGELTREAVGDA